MNWPTKWLWRSDFLEKKSWKKKDKIDERGHLSPLQKEKTGEQIRGKTNATSSHHIPIKKSKLALKIGLVFSEKIMFNH